MFKIPPLFTPQFFNYADVKCTVFSWFQSCFFGQLHFGSHYPHPFSGSFRTFNHQAASAGCSPHTPQIHFLPFSPVFYHSGRFTTVECSSEMFLLLASFWAWAISKNLGRKKCCWGFDFPLPPNRPVGWRLLCFHTKVSLHSRNDSYLSPSPSHSQ